MSIWLEGGYHTRRILAAIFDVLDLQNIHLFAPDAGVAAALDYVLNHNHHLTSLAVGHGIGAPGLPQVTLVPINQECSQI